MLAEEGCDLEVAARGADGLAELAAGLSGHNRVRVGTHRVDLGKSEDQRALVEACGAVDILINNAGSNPAGQTDECPEDPTGRPSMLSTRNGVWVGERKVTRRTLAGILSPVGSSGLLLVAARRSGAGETFSYVLPHDNFSLLQRTLLFMFRLDDD